MDDSQNHGWSLGFAFGGFVAALLFWVTADCVRPGPFGAERVEWSALDEATGAIACTNAFGWSTYELNQLETFLAAVLVGAVLGGLWEVLSLYRRSTSPAD